MGMVQPVIRAAAGLTAVIAVLAAAVPAASGAADPAGAPGGRDDRGLWAEPPGAASGRLGRVRWRECGDGLRCGKLSVPVDWKRPAGTRTEIDLAWLPARDPLRSLGPLVVNTGEGSTIQGVRARPDTVSELARWFDVVLFEPRGIGDRGSAATVRCSVPPPDPRRLQMAATEAAWRSYADDNAAYDRGCRIASGPAYDGLTAWQVAHDLDALRDALGRRRLRYVGNGYGAVYGQAYLELFPGRVGRMYLEGVPDHSEPSLGRRLIARARAAERQLRFFRDWCAAQPGCPIDGDAIAVLDDLLKRAPLPVQPGHGRASPPAGPGRGPATPSVGPESESPAPPSAGPGSESSAPPSVGTGSEPSAPPSAGPGRERAPLPAGSAREDAARGHVRAGSPGGPRSAAGPDLDALLGRSPLVAERGLGGLLSGAPAVAASGVGGPAGVPAQTASPGGGASPGGEPSVSPREGARIGGTSSRAGAGPSARGGGVSSEMGPRIDRLLGEGPRVAGSRLGRLLGAAPSAVASGAGGLLDGRPSVIAPGRGGSVKRPPSGHAAARGGEHRPSSGDGRADEGVRAGRVIDERRITAAVLAGLEARRWPELARALAAAEEGDARALAALAGVRRPDAPATVSRAMYCHDFMPAVPGHRSFLRMESRLREIAPRVGWLTARYEVGKCLGLDTRPSWRPHPLRIDRSRLTGGEEPAPTGGGEGRPSPGAAGDRPARTGATGPAPYGEPEPGAVLPTPRAGDAPEPSALGASPRYGDGPEAGAVDSSPRESDAGGAGFPGRSGGEPGELGGGREPESAATGSAEAGGDATAGSRGGATAGSSGGATAGAERGGSRSGRGSRPEGRGAGAVVLVGIGRLDLESPPAAAARLAGRIPGAVVLWHGDGHDAYLLQGAAKLRAACLRARVHDFLVNGVAPAARTVCPGELTAGEGR